jgi:hypothetical protein
MPIKQKAEGKIKRHVLNVVPDKIDLRDRLYSPPVSIVPQAKLMPFFKDLPVLNQGDTNACTGFALANVIYHLQLQSKRAPVVPVSPFMLYSMARRYDEFPGDPTADSGSSLRGAMKGWFKHGACDASLWKTISMPQNPKTPVARDWWLNAVKRPMGAYYRIDTNSIGDLQVALNDIRIIYASVVCHEGWDAGINVRSKGEGVSWIIPIQKAKPSDGGHAFIITGYTENGFIIQNSWGTDWGNKGLAILTYEDWLENAMDCWVAQLGVVRETHLEIAGSRSLRYSAGSVQLASETSLRNREIDPFIIDMANNGKLSQTGEFRTQESDVRALVNLHLDSAYKNWGLGKNDPIDIAIYAHGGLVSEKSAADTATRWIKALYENKIFPIFFMWETDLLSTLKNRLEDLIQGEPRPAGGLLGGISRWWNERLERLLSAPGSMIWGEMKQNAEAIVDSPDSGGQLLYKACKESPLLKDPKRVRLHLIGHSAGSILHSHIVKSLGGTRGWTFESVTFMAPAVRYDTFKETVVPLLQNNHVKNLYLFHLTDEAEQKDPTCRPILGYNRSLLYLVSQSFERGRSIPILGMEKFFGEMGINKLSGVKTFASPGNAASSATHGDFDNDDTTLNSVMKLIKAK